MANYSNLINSIKAVIKQNGTNDITGQLMQDVLVTMTNTIGRFAAFAGTAMPSTNPNNPDQTVYYLTSIPGTYVNFGGIVVPPDRLVALHNISGAWEMVVVVTFSDGGTISIDPALDPDSVNPVENRAIYAVINDLITRVQALETATTELQITSKWMSANEVKAITNETYAGKNIIDFMAVASGVDAHYYTAAKQTGSGIYLYGAKFRNNTVDFDALHPSGTDTLQDTLGGGDAFLGGFISYCDR